MKIDKLGNMPGREVNLKPLTKLWKEVVVSTEDSLCPKTFLGGSGGGISSSTYFSHDSNDIVFFFCQIEVHSYISLFLAAASLL